DLYFRLNVIQITLPSLRERPEDIRPLASFFINHYNRKFKRSIQGLSPEAEQILLRYDWPGNVREVRNAIERAMILEDSSYLTPSSLPMSIVQCEDMLPSRSAGSAGADPNGTEGISLEDNERMLVTRALDKTNGNQTQAARLLRVTRDTLRYKRKKFNLK
ncbi:MAG TPA: helix-turn-helix domain-containing protein, partial [Bryobacteraceae bacterium]|nr:helix-turn-helix domain-containing protein [Bryobacteraceae bacterium]